MPEETTHKRRVRYKGTHPRTFEEKYKEHDPEKYADTVAKVIEKGSTPAGMHIPIMVNEILEFLQIRPGQKGLDATLGYGGHTRKMLEKLTKVSGTSELTGEVHIKDDVQTKGDSWKIQRRIRRTIQGIIQRIIQRTAQGIIQRTIQRKCLERKLRRDICMHLMLIPLKL